MGRHRFWKRLDQVMVFLGVSMIPLSLLGALAFLAVWNLAARRGPFLSDLIAGGQKGPVSVQKDSAHGQRAPGIRLSQVTLMQCSYQRVDFTGARLEDCQIRWSLLSDVNFTGARFTRCTLDKSGFIGSSFRGVRFQNCSARGTNFLGADFTGATAEQMDVRGACFRDAKVPRSFRAQVTWDRSTQWPEHFAE